MEGSVVSVGRVLLGNVQRRATVGATVGAAVASVAIVRLGNRLGGTLRSSDATRTRQACIAFIGWGRSWSRHNTRGAIHWWLAWFDQDTVTQESVTSTLAAGKSNLHGVPMLK